MPLLIRALVACGWFGIQTLFGGIAVHLMLAALLDSWAQLGGVGEVLALELGPPGARRGGPTRTWAPAASTPGGPSSAAG